MRGAAEEAPGVYKNIDEVAEVTEQAVPAAGLSFFAREYAITDRLLLQTLLHYPYNAMMG